MHDFGKIVYLDVQKTGSTYTSEFLRQNLLLKERRFSKHTPVTRKRWRSHYIISVREPLAQYISLYHYGLERRGDLAQSFDRQSYVKYYQDGSTPAFERWLALMLDPEPPAFLNDPYLRLQPAIFGLQTYRFLRLSFARPLRGLKNLATKPALQAYYSKYKLQGSVIKTENLASDLEKILLSELGSFFKPPEQVMSFLHKSEKMNKSKTGTAFQPEKLSPELVRYLKEKEWFIYENFYN